MSAWSVGGLFSSYRHHVSQFVLFCCDGSGKGFCCAHPHSSCTPSCSINTPLSRDKTYVPLRCSKVTSAPFS